MRDHRLRNALALLGNAALVPWVLLMSLVGLALWALMFGSATFKMGHYHQQDHPHDDVLLTVPGWGYTEVLWHLPV